MGYLGLDDTDSLMGGCTTNLFSRILGNLPDYAKVIGLPRLVRLYPFAKRRTRGNAAVCAEIEISDGSEDDWLNFLDELWEKELRNYVGIVAESEHNNREQYPSDPGLVWFDKQPDRKFYYSCVRREIKANRLPNAVFSRGGHGLIGATAACAWPMAFVTYETIAYRLESNIGTQRKICSETLGQIDAIEGTFWSRDPSNGKGLIAPRGPCPVLFGIRARDAETSEMAAKKMIDSEECEQVDFIATFATNQCSDDHISGTNTGVVKEINVLKNGHVALTVNKKTWMAFRSSGDVKNLAQSLRKGDELSAKGLWKDSQTLHLEKLMISKAVPRDRKRPLCTDCNVRTKSMGKDQGVRCPRCGERFKASWEYSSTDNLEGIWSQPPLDSRRHLAKPIEWD